MANQPITKLCSIACRLSSIHRSIDRYSIWIEEQNREQPKEARNRMTWHSVQHSKNKMSPPTINFSGVLYRRLTIHISLWGWLVGVPKMYIFDIIAIHYNFPRLIIAQALIEFTMIYYTGNKNCLVSHSPFFLILLQQQQHNNIIILTQFLTLNARCQQHDGI
jgi:hypothetical protein